MYYLDANTINGENQAVYEGAYSPITTYKWYLFKQDGISMLCANDDAVNKGNQYIDSANLAIYMDGEEWNGYTSEQKREVLKLIWNGSSGSSLSFDDITNNQFIDAVGQLEEIIQIDVEYAPSAVGSSYSERYSNYEVTL